MDTTEAEEAERRHDELADEGHSSGQILDILLFGHYPEKPIDDVDITPC